MGVLDNLNIIKSCKEDIKQAIADKGVDMTNVAFTEYATKISEIQAGGGSGDYLDVRANLSTYYSTVESVPQYAFYTMNITSVNLPNCKTVGTYAFASCTSLTEVNLPMCESIYDRGFASCESLSEIDLPKCSYISISAFFRCSKLSSVNLPNCSYINASAFASCTSLQSVNLPMCSYVGLAAFVSCTSLQSVNLPMCSYVGFSAFSYCTSLQSVNLQMCSYIDRTVFSNCTSLTNLDLRSTYSCMLVSSNAFLKTPFASGNGSIYVHAAHLSQFQNGTNWTYFSKCLVGVGDATKPLLSFDSGRVYGDTEVLYDDWKSYLGINNSSIISIDLTNLVSVKYGMFTNCMSLTEVNLPKCSYVGVSAFQNCTSLQSVNLPMCSYVNEFTFERCSSLQTVNLPMCEYVGEFGFNYCKSLTTINLPMCSYLGNLAFQGVYSISTIYLGTSLSTVCEVGQNPITVGMGKIPDIYVPTSLVSAYKTHPYWSNFSRNIYGV